MTKSPMLSPNDIRNWLKAIQHNQDYPAHICEQIPTLHIELEKLVTSHLKNYTATQWITQQIQVQYNLIRERYHLPLSDLDLSRKETIDQIRQDFVHNNKIIEAWSVLYHFYVRVDLSFSESELEKMTLQSTRNLRRRKKLGYKLLYEVILVMTN